MKRVLIGLAAAAVVQYAAGMWLIADHHPWGVWPLCSGIITVCVTVPVALWAVGGMSEADRRAKEAEDDALANLPTVPFRAGDGSLFDPEGPR